jgi:hypothetical protein
MPYKTLEEIRTALQARCGFGATGASAGVNRTLMNSFIQQAQVLLYWTHDWARLRRYETKTLGASAYLLDYPTDANPERIKAVSVNRAGIWSQPLPKGITPEMYTHQDVTSWPKAWEPYAQMEFYPITDTSYDIRIFYIKNLDRFTENSDRATIDDDLIFTVALGPAKAHYRQPDAELYIKTGADLLAKLKAKSWGKDVFNRNEYRETELVMPVSPPRTV